MRISLTGHTKGLGKELQQFFTSSHTILGYSRSNGYDIKNPNNREKIISESSESDVFINLVHNYYHQTDLLFELYKVWENQNKLIVNISSLIVDLEGWGKDRFDYIEYKNQKIALESMSRLLSSRQSMCQIRNYKISEINFKEDTIGLNNIINEFRLSKK
jgi:hypothetical protein